MTALPPTMDRRNRPLIKKIKEHESHSRLHLHNPDDFSHNQSAPAHHSQTTGHKIAWDRTTILTTTRYKTQLDLTEHTAIKTRNPSLNRTDSAPTCSKLWGPHHTQNSLHYKTQTPPASPSPRRSDFIILVYFIILDSYC